MPEIKIGGDEEFADDLMALLKLIQGRNWSTQYAQKVMCVFMLKIQEAIEMHRDAVTH